MEGVEGLEVVMIETNINKITSPTYACIGGAVASFNIASSMMGSDDGTGIKHFIWTFYLIASFGFLYSATLYYKNKDVEQQTSRLLKWISVLISLIATLFYSRCPVFIKIGSEKFVYSLIVLTIIEILLISYILLLPHIKGR